MVLLSKISKFSIFAPDNHRFILNCTLIYELSVRFKKHGLNMSNEYERMRFVAGVPANWSWWANGLTTTKRGASIAGCHGIKGSLDSQRMGHIRGWDLHEWNYKQPISSWWKKIYLGMLLSTEKTREALAWLLSVVNKTSQKEGR